MREIKFKAKRMDNNEWVYGCLIESYCFKNKFIRWYEYNKKIELIAKDYEVIPETVCQFTGRQDMNGKDIYEHDRVVKKLIVGPKIKTVGSFKPFEVKYGVCSFNLNFMTKHTCEIVGNKFDGD